MYHLMFPRTRAGFKTRVSKIILVKDSNLNQGPLQEKKLGAIGAGITRSLMATVTVIPMSSSLLEVSSPLSMPSGSVTLGPAD